MDSIQRIGAFTPDGLLVVSAHGRVRMANPAAERMFLCAHDWFIGADIHSLLPSWSTFAARGVDSVSRPNAADSDEAPMMRGRRSDQTSFPVALYARPWKLCGERVTVCLVRDLSVQHELEHALRTARADIAAAREERERTLVTACHELLAPLSSILGLAEKLRGTSLGAGHSPIVDAISDAGQTMLRTIDDLLDLSMLSAGTARPNWEPFQLPELVERVTARMASDSAAAGVALEVRIAADVPTTIASDPRSLEHILANLIANAIGFAERGRVRMNVTSEQLGEDALLRFDIADTGGVSAEDRDALLQHPVGLHSPSASLRSGLRLAIGRRLIESLGGAIGVRVADGRGTGFWFTTPVQLAVAHAENGAAQAPGAGPAGSPGGADAPATTLPASGAIPINVLVADDNPINRKLAKRLLERLGCVVELADNGAQAVALVRESRFDLVFMDCHMPHMDGFEATREIRRREKAWQSDPLPIVALTASVLETDRDRCFASGMDAFANKPINPDEIRGLVQKVVARRAPLSAEDPGAAGPPAEPGAAAVESAPGEAAPGAVTTRLSKSPTIFARRERSARASAPSQGVALG